MSKDCFNPNNVAEQGTQIDIEDLPEGFGFIESQSRGLPDITFVELLSVAEQDECSCNRCKLTVSSRIKIPIENSDEDLVLSCEFTGYAEACSVTEIPFTMGQWGVILNPGISEAAVNAALQWANSLDITASVTLRQGCCSKCSHYFNGCPDMEPFGDPNSIELSVGDYGVVTELEETVEGAVENGPLTGWTFTSSIRQYVPCISETECGCDRCAFGAELITQLYAPLSDDNPFGDQNVSLLFEACGFLEDCDQTEIVFSSPTSWVYFSELSVGVSETEIADAIS